VHQIRAAGPADYPFLPGIEKAADALLAGALAVPDGGAEPPVLPEPPPAEDYAGALAVLVAGSPPCGFVRLEEVDGHAHLEQLSVRPDAARQGLGRALVAAAVNHARSLGYAKMTLCTFAEVPFNGPFYADCGFVPMPAPGPELAALRRHEEMLGLERLGRRTAMEVELQQ
jgi:GNAT superfamily N-acetyltransferase